MIVGDSDICMYTTIAQQKTSFNFLALHTNARIAAIGGENISVIDKDVNTLGSCLLNNNDKVNIFLIFTWPSFSTTPAARLEMCNGTPASTKAIACFPASVLRSLIRPITFLVAGS